MSKSKLLETGYWTFFCNPKYWQIDTFLEDLNNGTQSEIDTWRIADWQKNMFKIGDYGVIRVGVDKRSKKELKNRDKLNPGIYAIVKIIKLPNIKNNKLENKTYWASIEKKDEKKLSVGIEFVKNLIENPIFFKTLEEKDTINTDKYLVKGFQSSSMPLEKNCFDRILEISNIDYSNINDKDFYNYTIDAIEKEFSEFKETEKNSLVKCRITQGKFKQKLRRISNQCMICGLDIDELLIASHIKPWKDSDNQERVSFYNGFLLCPTHDKLFDLGFITFTDNGKIVISDRIKSSEYSKININEEIKINILDGHKYFLKWHREKVFIGETM